LIRKLRLVSFRAYDEVELEFDAEFNRIIGANGVGKTSLLEATAHLGFGNSPWSGRNSDVIKKGEQFAIIHGNGKARQQDVKIRIKRGTRKEVYLADKRLPKLSELLGIFPITAVGPQEIELVKGSPTVRRRMLDSALCQVDTVYTDALSKYKKILAERNFALKGVKSGSLAGGHVLIDTLDEALAPEAGTIMESRMRFINDLSKHGAEIYKEMTAGKGGELSLQYKPTIGADGKGAGEISEDFYKKIAARRKRDLDSGDTILGPHRDDLLFIKGKEEMARFGSWGQARASSLAALLGASKILHSGTNSPVSLILDDCFAELDPDNTSRFVEIASRYGQVILASSREIEPPEGKKGALFTFEGVGNVRRTD